jgi:2,5-furandicarboxylate decarboxylase 1
VDDLQSFLTRYAEDFPHLVWRVSERVGRDYVVTAAATAAERLSNPPLLVFHDVEDAGMPVVTNLFSSRARIAYALGVPSQQLHAQWAERSRRLLPPVRVTHGVCQEVCSLGEQADATRLPLSFHFEQDAGRYLTSGVLVARDPDTGSGNLSFARMQLKGPRRFGISLHSRGHLWDYQRRAEARGQPLEVAVVVGMHPAFLIGAASRVAMEIDEYDIAGSLLGHPLEVVLCRTVDLCVPAAAEIVLEGVIEAGEREDEGPFGEYTGYATARSTRNVFTLRAITRRSTPYFLDVCPGASKEHLLLGRVQKEAEILRRLREVLPNVRAIHYPTSGTHYHCYVSIDKLRPGDGRHAALLVLGLDPYVKLVIAVDADIDVTDEPEVMWALATRVQPKEDASIIDEMTCNVLDPSSRDGLSSKLAIDATRPAGFDAQRCTLPQQAVEQAARILHGHTTAIPLAGSSPASTS